MEDSVGAKFYCPYAVADSNSAFGLGRRRWSSPQQCYIHCLGTLKKLIQDTGNTEHVHSYKQRFLQTTAVLGFHTL